MRRLSLFLVLYSFFFSLARAQETERQYLSGHGCDDMVEWDFKCVSAAGAATERQAAAGIANERCSGQWTKIGVPSCWELQGFGTYQYGMRFYGKATPEGIADEKGFYKTEFTLPQRWQGRQILLVFEGVFTDANVTINGRKAGQGLYQGGFTRHTIDVSDRVFFGQKKNRLEVEVAKESANPQVNMAERRADYWNFGGIWRPVFIVSKPMQNISRVAINAKADGRFQADVFLNRALPSCSVSVCITDANGTEVAASPAFAIGGDGAKVDFTVSSPKPWNAEQPHLYTAVFTLKDAQGRTLHVERQRFGFRTIEYRHTYNGDSDDGVFINGQKVIMKGVNRHSFRPETGRTLSKAKNIEDVLLIKSMNMNAVRLSHYPADPEFLDACDSLGLYVECELPGWHQPHETIVGSQLAEEMVTRDVNHPSIIFWSNGNEGGFNYELEPVFTKLDPQQRVVLYPWANRNGFETKHYRSWGETAEYMRQKEIFMPTEFLHGLYDGGHGAGLKDYWQLMLSNPRCAGGFLWDLQDQAVLRTDWGSAPQQASQHATPNAQLLDPVGNFGSDGIVGPHGEREGSYYTIKEIWSPVQLRYGETANGDKGGHAIEVRNAYDFTNLRDCRFTGKFLAMPAYGETEVQTQKEFHIPAPTLAPGAAACLIDFDAKDAYRLQGDVLSVTATDLHGEEIFTWAWPIQNAKPYGNRNPQKLQPPHETDSELSITAANTTYTFSKKTGRLLHVKTAAHSYSLANGPRFVAAKRADRSDDGFYNHDDKQAFQKKTQYNEYADQGVFHRFAYATDAEDGQVPTLIAYYRHGSLQSVTWQFYDDGSVSLAAVANFNGVIDLMGICFDYPEDKVKGKHWVGRGPYRVWQNRMEGPQYGYWQTAYNDPVPGESWQYPEFKGYFADVAWMQIETTEGKIGILPGEARSFVGVFTPRDGRDHLLYTLPQTGIALLNVIPAVRNKVNTTDLNGPSAQPYRAQGTYTYDTRLVFE